MADLKTNLNVSPYYDDFSEDKNFHRVLYRPATAVQARELTTSQSILQNQIGRQGEFIHKEGAFVKGRYTIFYGANNASSQNGDMLNFVRVDDTFLTLGGNTNVSVNNNMQVFWTANHSVTSALYDSDDNAIVPFNTDKETTGAYLVGQTSGVIQVVWFYQNGFEAQFPNTNVLFTTDYADGFNNGVDTTFKEFQKDETIFAFTDSANAESYRASLIGVANTLTVSPNTHFASIKTYNNTANALQSAVGGSVGITTTDGIVFAKNHFIRSDRQRAVVQAFDDVALTTEKYVGFEVTESLITPELDSSLFDNATGSTNEQAPGAHRLKLEATLKCFDGRPANTFSTILVMGNTGIVEQVLTQPDLNEQGLGKVISNSIRDTSGDFVIGKPTLKFKSISSNTTHANVQINPVPGGTTLFNNGQRHVLTGPTYKTIRRGTDTVSEENVTTTMNYGNYLLVDEVAGRLTFDKYAKIYLVGNNNTIGAVSNNYYNNVPKNDYDGDVIGNTTLLSVIHDSGTFGEANAVMRFYVSDINLISGASFSDVKSLMIMDGGNTDPLNAIAFADLANTEIQAQERQSLVFDTGLPAVEKFLIGSNTDTQYVARTRVADTIDTSGVISFTVSDSKDSEDQPASIGTNLGDTIEKDFIIIPHANLVSATATTTLSFGSGSNTLTLSDGTSSSDLLKPGDVIEVSRAGVYSTSDLLRITSVDGTTIRVAQNTGGAGSGNNYRRVLRGGQPLNLDGTTSNITTTSTTVTINTRFGKLPNGSAGGGAAAIASGDVDVIFNKQRTEVRTPAEKEINKNIFVKIDVDTNDGGTTGPWILGLPDVHRLRKVYIGSSYATTETDKTAEFDIDPGQRDNKYALGRLKLKTGSTYTIASGSKILVEFDHFTANTQTGEGFYTVESYPISADDPTSANSTTILTSEIPNFKSPRTGKVLDLRNSIDFRPRVANTANGGATAISGATENPAASDTLILTDTATASFISTPNKNFVADMTYFQGRADILTFNDGKFQVVEGVPSDLIKTPFPAVPQNEMQVAEIRVPPFPSLTDDESISPAIPNTNRGELKYKHRINTNRRFTMKDIGALAERISRLEYFTSLSLLEKDAAELNIADSSGNNRFKNGIFVDNFTSHVFADLSKENGNHLVSIDEADYHIRPTYEFNDIDLQFDSTNSTNVTKYGSFITLPLDTASGNNGHIVMKEVTTGTNSRNLVDPVFEHHGTVLLCPNFDTRSEREGDPFEVNIELDLVSPLEPLNVIPGFGNAWRDVNSSGTSRTVTGSRRVNRNQVENTILNSRTVTQARDVFSFGLDATNTTYEINNIIQDIRFNRYIRPQRIGFVGFGLMPNSRCHFFFDDELVDDLVRPGRLNEVEYASVAANTSIKFPTEGLNQDNRDSVVPAVDSAIGDAIFADSEGFVYGVLEIPANRFFQGERSFRIGEFTDLESSDRFSAQANFLGFGINYISTDLTLTTVTPEIAVNSNRQTQVINDSWTTTNRVWAPDNPPNNDNPSDPCAPIAQTFRITEKDCEKTTDQGVFVSELDIFYRTKHPSLGTYVSIHKTTKGQLVPDFTQRVPYSLAFKESADVVTDGNTNGPVNATTFKFKNPIYLAKGETYAFIVHSVALNDGYNIWLSRLGGEDGITGEQVGYNDLGWGTAFFSKNAATWQPIQNENVTYKLRRAKFQNVTGTVKLQNAAEELCTIDTIALQDNAVPVRQGDLVIQTGTPSLRGFVEYINTTTSNLVISSSTANGASQFSNTDHIDFIRLNSALDASGNPTSNIELIDISSSNTTHIGNTTIDTLKTVGAHGVVLQLNPMNPSGTTTTFTYRGLGNNFSTIANLAVPLNDELEFSLLEGGSSTRIIASRSLEAAQATDNKSAVITATLGSDSQGLTPVLDLNRRNLGIITNNVNNKSNLESTNSGQALSRYISKPIELADGQDAEDLEVYLTAYRPPLTSLDVYCKVLSATDADLFEDKSWSKMVLQNDDSITSTNQFDTKEYRYKIKSGSVPTDNYANGDSFSVTSGAYLAPAGGPEPEDNVIVYVKNGVYFQRFKYFAIKIVLLSSAPEIVPFVKDVRALALQL